jgi:UDP-GlcNAc:undecaprenyl-phosphate GlcNAc-1-phosphate transferase
VLASFLSFIAAFGLAAVLTIGLRLAALRWGLVDIPDSRKVHEGHVPLCGGIAIFSAFGIANVLFGSSSPTVPWNLALALGLLVLCGAADDRWRLPVGPRLFIHFTAAAMMVLPAVTHGIDFGTFLDESPAWLLPLALVFSTFLVVGLINATNMSDGADGLCGGWSAAALFWLALMARDIGQPELASMALLLLATVIGFLAFNMRHPWRSRASVFMGDAGSVALGGALGFLLIALCSGSRSIPLPLLAWIVVVPMTDMASLVVRRFLAGRSPMSADRWHLHHLVLDLGVPHAAAVGLIVIASATCGAIAWAAYVLEIPDSVLAAGLVVPVIAHTAFVLAATRQVAQHANRTRLQAEAVLKIGAGGLEGSG